MELDVIHCGDCLDVMAGMEDAIFQTCITSPPYWGLRDYGLEPIVWDGDSDCSHEWGDAKKKPIKLQAGNPEFQRQWREEATAEKSNTGSFCIHCGAWLGSLGLEPTPELYVSHLVSIFAQVKRLLRDNGTLWLNIGDSYWGGGNNRGNNSPISAKQASNKGAIGQCAEHQKNVGKHHIIKPKDMVMIPFRLALALQADGWWVRSDIIWHKPNCMPSSVKDRPTTDFEHVFLLAKSKRYYYDADAIREPHTTKNLDYEKRKGSKWGHKKKHTSKPNADAYTDPDNTCSYNPKGRNKRTVWTVNTKPYKEYHFATFPPALIEPMILAGSAEDDIVFDPFAGSGTVCAEAKKHGRHWVGIEANPEYCKMAEKRIRIEQAQLKLDFS